MNIAIILAGGKSTRFGSDKPLQMISDKPMIMHSVDAFLQAKVDKIIVVANTENAQKSSAIRAATTSTFPPITARRGRHGCPPAAVPPRGNRLLSTATDPASSSADRGSTHHPIPARHGRSDSRREMRTSRGVPWPWTRMVRMRRSI